MSVTSFMFGGKSPPNSPATGGNTNVPQFVSDAQMKLVNQANTLANDPYSLYPGPRVAPASGDQTSAWNQIRMDQGKWDPAFKGALKTASDTMGNVNPYFTGAATDIGGAGGSKFTGSNVTDYMNPYIDNVVNRSKDLAMRNWNENTLPQLNSMFVGSGQFGSSPNASVAFNKARDLTEDIDSQANSQYAGAYDTAGSNFRADQTRRLQAGEALGTLGSNYGALENSTANTMANTATAGQNAQYTDTNQLQGAGAAQRGITQQSVDQGYQDFINQRDWQWNQMAKEQQILNGNGQTSSDWSYTGPSKVYGQSPLASGAAGAAAMQGVSDMTQNSARGGLMLARHARGGLARVLASNEIPEWLREAIQIDMQEHRRRGH